MILTAHLKFLLACTAGAMMLAAAPNAVAGPGSPDPSFGTGGLVRTEVGADADLAHGVALQTDGKIVSVGFDHASGGLTLVRYLPSGQLDTGFGGGDGIAQLDLAAGVVSTGSDVVVQGDGRLVAVGENSTSGTAVAARFTVAGALDLTYGGGDGYTEWDANGAPGSCTTDTCDQVSISAAALQAGNGVVVVGDTHVNSTPADPDARDIFVSRLDTDGTLLTRSVVGAEVGPVTQGLDRAMDIAPLSDGKLVAVGYTAGAGADNDFLFLRYSSSGELEPASVARVGAVTGSDDRALAVTVQAGDKVVAAGSTANAGNSDVQLMRIDAGSWALDAAFGSGGKLTKDLGSTQDAAFGIGQQSDGKLVVAATTQPAARVHTALLRLSAVGATDTSFGTSGVAKRDIDSSSPSPNAHGDMVVQPNGRIVVATSTGATAAPGPDFAALRFIGLTADLRARLSSRSSSLVVGRNIALAGRVTNLGPDAATAVTTRLALGKLLKLVSVTPSQGSCSAATCSLGTIPSGGVVTLTVAARGLTGGLTSSTLSAHSSNIIDENARNNSGRRSLRVLPKRVVLAMAVTMKNGMLRPCGSAPRKACFQRRRDRAFLSVRARPVPPYAVRAVTLTLFKKKGRRWVPVRKFKPRLGTTGQLRLAVPAAPLSRDVFRIRGAVAQSPTTAAAVSPYRYLRVY